MRWRAHHPLVQTKIIWHRSMSTRQPQLLTESQTDPPPTLLPLQFQATHLRMDPLLASHLGAVTLHQDPVLGAVASPMVPTNPSRANLVWSRNNGRKGHLHSFGRRPARTTHLAGLHSSPPQARSVRIQPPSFDPHDEIRTRSIERRKKPMSNESDRIQESG